MHKIVEKKFRQNIPLSLAARKPNRFFFNHLWRAIVKNVLPSQYYSHIICLLDIFEIIQNKTDFMSATFPHDIKCNGLFITTCQAQGSISYMNSIGCKTILMVSFYSWLKTNLFSFLAVRDRGILWRKYHVRRLLVGPHCW